MHRSQHVDVQGVGPRLQDQLMPERPVQQHEPGVGPLAQHQLMRDRQVQASQQKKLRSLDHPMRHALGAAALMRQLAAAVAARLPWHAAPGSWQLAFAAP